MVIIFVEMTDAALPYSPDFRFAENAYESSVVKETRLPSIINKLLKLFVWR